MLRTTPGAVDALVCPGGGGRLAADDDASGDTEEGSAPLTPAFGNVDSQVDSSPNFFEALIHPNETAAYLAQAVPQASLLEVLDQLTPATLDADGQIDALVAIERHIGLLQARALELVAALDAGDRSRDGFTQDNVAAALRVPPASMRTRMSTARDLAERLPNTLTLLRAGRISQRHAFDLAEATSSLCIESAGEVEARVLARAPEQTSAQFRASAKRAVLRVASPAEDEQAHVEAVSERRVVAIPADRDMAYLNCYLSADAAATVMAALDAIAYETVHGRGGDTRTADQRRTDALVEVCAAALSDRFLSKGHGQRPSVQVTVAASTLMGLDHQPGELDGYGPITAAMARRIAGDPTGQWRRLLTDDGGVVQKAGRKTYRPPADMIRTVIARDMHCTYPGCRKKSQYNDLDHVDAYRPGDETTPANLMSLCRRHHRLKHTGAWRVERDDGTAVTTWTDQHGRRYQGRPPTRPTTTTDGSSGGNMIPTAAAPTTAAERHHTPLPPPTSITHSDDRPPF